MIPNNSPWIKQLNRTRPVTPLNYDIDTDIAIVGGGIAGVVTAYFILRDTEKNVTLFEADKVAHGATGHNAGQITSYFERPFSELVQEFGLASAAKGQASIESAWGLLDTIHTEAKLQMPLYTFTGHAACSNREQLLLHLKNNRYRQQAGLELEDILIAEETVSTQPIPPEYNDLYATVPHQYLLSLLETNNSNYIASVSFSKGCMNSALFTEELAGYLLATYKDRFALFEGSPVQQMSLQQHRATLAILDYCATTKKVVLCTNGFENFTIVNQNGPDIDTKFHYLVQGTVGYMVGYFEPLKHPPTAISYLTAADADTKKPYFYITRRRHEHEEKKAYNLICVGGPEKPLSEAAKYSRGDSCSEEMRNLMDAFLRKNYRHVGIESIEYAFCWHGLMGYTPNGVRLVGVEPCNPVLLYNLGCNGVGILPSIYGGKRIADIVADKKVEPSIFDPRDQRCLLEGTYEDIVGV